MSNYVDVIIDEKVYSLGGSDNSDYIQMVAAYINDKIQTLKAQPIDHTYRSAQYCR